jgi:hypothetical protein
MFGDIHLGDFADTRFEITLLGMYVAADAIGAAIIPFIVSRLPREQVSRRSFLRAVGTMLWLWGTPPLLANIIQITGLNDKQQTAIKKLSSRIIGLISDFHPERARVFFRNAIIANNLLTMASAIKHQTNSIPKIAFQIEGTHSGIEDFLEAGQDVCRTIILSHPKIFLQNIVNHNGGLEALCTSRLFKLPKETHYENGVIPDSIAQGIQERRITDISLLNRLSLVLLNN